MRGKLFTFRYSATMGGFDNSPLIEFTRAFREHVELPGQHLVPASHELVELHALQSGTGYRPSIACAMTDFVSSGKFLPSIHCR